VVNASFCHKCGENVWAVQAPSEVSSNSQIPTDLGSICTVCKLRIKEGEDTVQCPYCGYNAHRTHMLEWLHVKNYCPVCHMHLDEKDLK
jgi:predicted RNA-binding Zn-ribbon protein involved in translation (DUF1610 family)